MDEIPGEGLDARHQAWPEDEMSDDELEADHQAWLAEQERKLGEYLTRSLVHVRGGGFDPERHRLAVEVAEALARCGLWLGAAPERGAGGVSVNVGFLDPEDIDEVVVGWSLPKASVTRPYEGRVHELMHHVLAELLELMGFHVDRHQLPARGVVDGLIVTRREDGAA